MRFPLLAFIALIIFNGLIDLYIVRAVWKRCTERPRLWRSVALGTSIALALFLTTIFLWPKKSTGDAQLTALMTCLYSYMAVYAGKITFIALDLIGKIPRLFRRKAIRHTWIVAAVTGTAVTASMFYGMSVTRNTIQVKTIELSYPTLPEAFDGLIIAQISDIHTGSYAGDTTHLCRMADSIAAHNPDIILFTGDIVNRHSSELTPFTRILSSLSAPLGVYSVMGNHDYGDYMNWPDHSRRRRDARRLKAMQAGMGWTMLNDSTAWLRAGNDSIALIGVENIGEPPFRTYGSLARAYTKPLSDSNFKILLSHNPKHWTDSIISRPEANIALTLSGHTHAMQLEIGSWSPSQYIYPTWGGIYGDENRKLYVNIGIGTVGMPARIGATPEITIITLNKSR